MACRKCGSDWLTPLARDCNSCPHCSKVQRSVERKRGRWIDKECTLPCKHCGKAFTAKVFAESQKPAYCSKVCRSNAKAEWRKKWLVSYCSGVRKQTQSHGKRQHRACLECEKHFKKQAGSNSSNMYCSKTCFFAARASGKQAWDKTNIKKVGWHQGGWYASAPSVQLMRRIAKAHAQIARVAGGFERLARKELNRPTCDRCGTPCNDGASRFCSHACNKAWRGQRACRCGVGVDNASAFGPPPMCVACRVKARREWRRIAKHTRARVRRGGGYWNPQVKPAAVFKRDNWTCYLCNAQCSRVYSSFDPLSATIDHVYPVAHGGDHDWHNVRTACAFCNAKKRDKVRGQRLLKFGPRLRMA